MQKMVLPKGKKPRRNHTMTENKNCSCVQNVGCSVKDCKYHSESNMCCATAIKVSNENAQRKADTFCSTFENKAGL